MKPIGKLDANKACPRIETLREFAEAYFCLPVKILDEIHWTREGKDYYLQIPNETWGYPITSRKNKNKLQFYVMDILKVLKDFLPKDGYCVMGVLMEDIYEVEDLDTGLIHICKFTSVILGRGTGDRVGLISLNGFDPLLSQKKKKYNEEHKHRWLLRVCKVI